jgi:ParB-like nuclease domain
MLDISKIRLDGGTQSRMNIDEATVSEYAEAMLDPITPFPPVLVYHDGTDYWLADGFHRVAAWQRIGRSDIPVDIRGGDQRTAILASLAANWRNGLRRTNDDKRRAVLTLLQDPEWSQWPQGKIAEACRVSREFVNRVGQEMFESCDRSQDATRTVDRSGKTYQQNTRKIGKTKSEVSADAPPELQNNLEGAPVQSPDQGSEPAGSAVEDARNALGQLPHDELIDKVMELTADLVEARATIEDLRTKNINLTTQLEAALAGDADTVMAGLHAELKPANVAKSRETEEKDRFGKQNLAPNEQVEDIWNMEIPF